MATPAASVSSPPPDGDRSRGFQDIAVHAILLGVSTTLLLLRLYTRLVIVKNIGLDDYLIVIGVVSGTLIPIYQPLPVQLIHIALVRRRAGHHSLHGPKWNRSTHILPFTRPTYLAATIISDEAAIHPRGRHDFRDHVRKIVRWCLPATDIRTPRHRKVVAMGPVFNRRVFRSEQHIFCRHRSDRVSTVL